MTFPLWYLLLPYIAAVLFAAVFLFFNVFHLMRYGIEDRKTYLIIASFIGGFLLILVASTVMFAAFNWSYEASLDEILPFDTDTSRNFGL